MSTVDRRCPTCGRGPYEPCGETAHPAPPATQERNLSTYTTNRPMFERGSGEPSLHAQAWRTDRR